MAGTTTKVSVGVKLTAVVDGTTIQGSLLSTKPLVQAFSETDKSVVIPDFATDALARPTIYFVMNDISTGEVFSAAVVKDVKWKYNGRDITFNESGLSTDPAGLFKLTTYQYTKDISLPAIQVVNNFPSFGNYDNDIISVEGWVEIEGSPIWVKNVNIPVIVKPKAGNVYSLQLNDIHGFSIPSDINIEYTETTVDLIIDGKVASGELIADRKISFVWKKIKGGQAEDFKVGKTVKIYKGDVDNVLILKCSAVEGEAKRELATIYQSYTDLSDPYLIVTKKIDKQTQQPLEGTVVRSGHTAVITPEVRSRGSNSLYTGPVTWSFTPYDNNGNVYTGTPAIQTFPKYCEVQHAAIVAAKRNMNIIIDAEITV